MQKTKKKVAMVYGGEFGMAAHEIVEAFGFEYLELPKSIDNFRRAEDYFPEEWCFDIKLMYADLLEAVNRGADIIVCITNGVFSFVGPCRLPYIADYQIEEKLKKFTGREFQYILFKFFPHVAFVSVVASLKKMGVKIYRPNNFLKLLRVLKVVKFKLRAVYRAKNIMRKKRARERSKGQAFRIYKQFEQNIKGCHGKKEIKRVFENFKNKIEEVQIEERAVLKLGIVGDLYGVFFDFPIFDLENYICDLFNVEILPTYTIYDFYFSKKWKKDKETNKKRDKYISYWAGGTDTTTIPSYIELMDREKADGIMQLRTFGCMPEEVSSLTLQAINRDQKKPPAFIILSYDDHSNAEGLKTRVEAFCNTLLRKKQNAR